MKDYQSTLFPYAYNILGSVDDALDAIQDVLLKYTTNKPEVDNEKNYLIRGVINQSINIKKQKSRFQSGEEWLPEPVSTERSDLKLEMNELVSYSMMYLLEKLNPKERAVFILKEAFAYSHQEIAEVLSLTEDNSRKLLSRANKKVHDGEGIGGVTTNYENKFKHLDMLVSAIRHKDLESIQMLLANEVEYYADGGGKVKVVAKHLVGAQEVSELITWAFHTFQKNYTIKPHIINHQPALLFCFKDKVIGCHIYEFDEQTGLITRMSVVLDPAKTKNIKISS